MSVMFTPSSCSHRALFRLESAQHILPLEAEAGHFDCSARESQPGLKN